MAGIVRLEADRKIEIVVRYTFDSPLEAQKFLYTEQQKYKLDIITQRAVWGRSTQKEIDGEN